MYLVRQQIQPGMTGWAQVNELCGDASIEKRVDFDLRYIQNWSAGLGIRILMKIFLGGMIKNEKIQKRPLYPAKETNWLKKGGAFLM